MNHLELYIFSIIPMRTAQGSATHSVHVGRIDGSPPDRGQDRGSRLCEARSKLRTSSRLVLGGVKSNTDTSNKYSSDTLYIIYTSDLHACIHAHYIQKACKHVEHVSRLIRCLCFRHFAMKKRSAMVMPATDVMKLQQTHMAFL